VIVLIVMGSCDETGPSSWLSSLRRLY